MLGLKNLLKSTMAEERMSDLAMHYSERISVDEVCLGFIQAHPWRLFQVSSFADKTV